MHCGRGSAPNSSLELQPNRVRRRQNRVSVVVSKARIPGLAAGNDLPAESLFVPLSVQLLRSDGGWTWRSTSSRAPDDWVRAETA